MKLNEQPKYPCPCCGNIVFYEKQNFEICNICHWQDDNVQFLDRDYRGGANILSLNECKKIFLESQDREIKADGSDLDFAPKGFNR